MSEAVDRSSSPAPSESAPGAWYLRHPRWVLFALTTLLLVAGLADLPLLDRDEPRFASATREMLERGDAIVPTFNGAERFDKPILIYWMMAAPYAAFGPSEWTARLPGVACSILLVLWVFQWGDRWYGRRSAFWGAAGLATTLQFLIHGRLAVADMPLILAIAVAMRAQWELLHSDRAAPFPWGWWWTLWLAGGLGFLAKGPLALLVPAISLVLFKAMAWRTPLPWGRLKAGLGLLVFLGVLAPWGLAALWVTEGRFWQVGMGQHVWERGLDAWGGRNSFFLYYLYTAPLSLAPYFALLGTVFWYARRHWTTETRYLVAWFVGLYVIFSCYATQLMHYVLPGFPALFLLLGPALGWASEQVRWPGRWWTRLAVAFYAVVLVALVAVVLLTVSLPAPLSGLAGAFGGLLAVALALGVVFAAVRWQSFRGLLVGVVLVAFGWQGFASALRAVHPVVQMAEQLRGLPDGTRLVAGGFVEGSLVFYSHDHWTLVPDDPQRPNQLDPNTLRAALGNHGPTLVVLMEEEVRTEQLLLWAWQRLKGGPENAPAWPAIDRSEATRALDWSGWKVRRIAGFNPGRARWCTIFVAERESRIALVPRGKR